MQIWSAEIKEIESLSSSVKGRFPDLEKELERLLKADDENMVLLYSRRCLEVIITDLCESELKRPRKTEPLKGIIDKLHREGKVPPHIISSMNGLNDLSTYGAHPKDFDPRQVKPVLNNLSVIIEWYLTYKNTLGVAKVVVEENVRKLPDGSEIPVQSHKLKNKSVITVSGILLFGIIIVLVLNLLGFFRRDKFKDIKDTDGRISIAVMPFINMTNDTLFNIWQNGFQDILITSLSNSKELAVRQYSTMYEVFQNTEKINYASITSTYASEISRKLEANTFIMGSIMEAGNKIRINAKLNDSETEEIYKTFSVEGNSEKDFLVMIDSMADLIKNYLEIKVLEDDLAPDIQKFFTINSAEAYRYAIQGYNSIINRDVFSAIQLYSKVIEIDSNYTMGNVILSMAYYSSGQYDKARDIINKPYNKRDKLSLADQLWVNFWHSFLDKEPRLALQYIKQIVALDPFSRFNLNFLGDLYMKLHEWENVMVAYEKYIETEKQLGLKGRWIYPYIELGQVYHETGNHKREQEVYEIGLSCMPDNVDIIKRQVICALSQGYIEKAQIYLSKYKSYRKEISLFSDSELYSDIGNIYEQAGLYEKAEEYYRKSLELESQKPSYLNKLARLLINHDINIDEGLKLINRALTIEPENPYYLDAKGWGLYKQGSIEPAQVMLKTAWDLLPEYDYNIFFHLQEVEQVLANENK
jgi:tetratricopeptide (TPR) repeat protein